MPRAPLAHCSTVALAVLFAGMIGLSPPALAAALDTAYVLDDFERVDWPDTELWVVHPGQGWRTSACQFVSGSRSLRAFGGTGSAERPCGPIGGAGAAGESAIDLRLDLRSAATANRLDLEFELWLGLPAAGAGETTGALFIELFVPDGSGFEVITVFGATSPSGAWTRPRRRLDLTAMADVADADHVYDLRGDIWTLRLRAVPSDGPVPGDVFIDDLTLIWEPDLSVPTPTVRPLSSPTPTSSPTRTVAPTPSPTVEPTPSPEPGPRLFLPWLSKPPAEIEPTPTPKPGPRLFLPWLSKPAVVIEPSPEPSPDVSPPPGTATSETPTAELTAAPSAEPTTDATTEATTEATTAATETPGAEPSAQGNRALRWSGRTTARPIARRLKSRADKREVHQGGLRATHFQWVSQILARDLGRRAGVARRLRQSRL